MGCLLDKGYDSPGENVALSSAYHRTQDNSLTVASIDFMGKCIQLDPSQQLENSMRHSSVPLVTKTVRVVTEFKPCIIFKCA